jgi:hypothetical protein
MADRGEQTGLLCIEISYVKGTSNPERIFQTASKLIESLKSLDAVLSQTLDPSLETVLTLEDTERGSLRTWIGTKLKNVPEDALRSGEVKKLAGHYLNEARLKVVEWCDKHPKQQTIEDVKQLQEEIVQIASNSGISAIPAFKTPDAIQLLTSMEQMSRSQDRLSEQEKVEFIAFEGRSTISKDFELDATLRESLVVAEIIQSTTTMVLKIKRPDLLGEARWEFKHGNEPISAKIEDLEWLSRHHRRDPTAQVMAGDALKVTVVVAVTYDANRNVIDKNYRITKVIEIVPPDSTEQNDLFDHNR